METEQQQEGKEKLIEDIMRDARAEADKILTDAKKMVEQRQVEAEKKLERIREEAENTVSEQVEAMTKNIRSSITVESQRVQLKMQNELIREIMAKVEEEIFGLIGTKGYRNILLGWVCEAAIGLAAEEAIVTVSARETSLVDKAFLKEAEEKIKQLTQRKIRLTLSGDNPCTEQGAILTTKDGKIAFNNCIPTRLLRHQLEIRKIIYNSLSKEGK